METVTSVTASASVASTVSTLPIRNGNIIARPDTNNGNCDCKYLTYKEWKLKTCSFVL